jgi:2-methylisocitrate lyase-like PEP mutase family enzyme
MPSDATKRWLSPAPPGVRRRCLRQALGSEEIVVAPGADCGMTARLIQAAGFPAVYMTGSGVANSLTGKPDVGLLTLTETAMMARFVVQATDVPVICDADDGYGNAINVIRTVQEFDAAGVSAIQIEDQLSPKRCGSIAGKEVIAAEDMLGKIRAALDARSGGASDEPMLIIARTDARGPLGLDEAIRRGRLYAAAGADMVFPDALLSVAEYARFAAEVPGPKMFNMGGYAKARTTPKLPVADVEAMGYALVIFPLASIRAGVRAQMDFLQGLKTHGTAHEIDHIAGLDGHPVENWYDFTGISTVRALENRYLDPDRVAARYSAGAGYQPPSSTD